MCYRPPRVALGDAGALPSSASSDAEIAQQLHEQELSAIKSASLPAAGISLGAFDGTRYYLNRIADELIDGPPLHAGRLEITDLIPAGCECAFTTTFCLDADSDLIKPICQRKRN